MLIFFGSITADSVNVSKFKAVVFSIMCVQTYFQIFTAVMFLKMTSLVWIVNNDQYLLYSIQMSIDFNP